MFHRAIVFVIGFCVGGLVWQRFWLGAAIGAALGLWAVLDEDALSIDSDRPTRYNRD